MVKRGKGAPKAGKAGAARKSTRSPSAKSAPRKAKRGLFITLEGGEGSGKSTQMKRLADYLEGKGIKVVTTREPGGSPGAEAVRHVLLSGAAEPFGPEMEAILFAASRGDHVDTVIEPALTRGEFVISDRFFDSTRVYQGVGGKVDNDFVRRLERIACRDTWPDLTLIIDVDPEEGMRRAGTRRKKGEAPDRFEKESLKLQKRRRNAYLEIARREPERCAIVDGSGSEETVFEEILKVVDERLSVQPAARKTGSRKSPTANKAASKPKLVSHKQLTTKRKAAKAPRKKTPDVTESG